MKLKEKSYSRMQDPVNKHFNENLGFLCGENIWLHSVNQFLDYSKNSSETYFYKYILYNKDYMLINQYHDFAKTWFIIF